MSAREIIARTLAQWGLKSIAEKIAQHVLDALTAAGYRILAPGEMDKETVDHLSNELDPEIGLPSDRLLREIHADLETRGRKNTAFSVTVHHRNISLSAVAKALRARIAALRNLGNPNG